MNDITFTYVHVLNKEDLMKQIDESEDKIYRLMDSFLTEAKDQNGNERSLERLNTDRHLFVKNIKLHINETIVKVLEALREENRLHPDEKLGSTDLTLNEMYNRGYNSTMLQINLRISNIIKSLKEME